MLDKPTDAISSPEPAEKAIEAADSLIAPPSPFALPPVSPDDPCGPDLDFDGDMDFMNFVAATEGALPGLKTEDYYNFNRADAGLAGAIQAGEKLLKRTLDVRLLVLMAKLSILNRDIDGFSRRVGNIAWLISEHWEAANPKGDGGDYGLRLAQLDTLEQNTLVLLPLQYAPLVETPREGALAYRDQLVATGAAQPRSITRYNLTGEKEASAPEKFMGAGAIQRVLGEVELGRLKGVVDMLTGLAQSVETIHAVTLERAGLANTIKLEKLDALVGGMIDFLRGALFKRDPSLAPPPEPQPGEVADAGAGAAGPSGPPPAFATRADVDAALMSALGYFVTCEPTSPALLLIRQARDTLGKNLYEVMKLLAPSHADAARVFVGPDSAFTIPVKNLSSAPTPEIERAEAEPAASREAALALMDAVANHMRRAEPSSPAPYLLDRARNLATRDFMSLLQEVLSEEAIASLKKGK